MKENRLDNKIDTFTDKKKKHGRVDRQTDRHIQTDRQTC